MSIYSELSSSAWFQSLVSQQKECGCAFAQNVKALSQGLQKGEHYIVRENRLSIRSHRSIWQRILYFFSHSKEEKATKTCISKIIRCLTDISLYPIPEMPLKELFFSKMRRLSSQIYDRSAIHKNFTYLLLPELAKTQKTPENQNDTQRKLARRVEKTRLAIKLGIELKPIHQGKSGSYFARDRNKKLLGVFKPAIEESSGSQSPKRIARIYYFMRKNIFNSLTPFWKNEGYLAEVMTYHLSQHMGCHVVPASKIECLESSVFARAKKLRQTQQEVGSFQIYVKESLSFDEAFHLKSRFPILGYLFLKINIWRYRKQIVKALIPIEFEQMTLIDLLICNRDRHFQNWLVTKNIQKGQRPMHLIDHQLSFPKWNPSQHDIFFQRNLHLWKHLPQARQPFSEEMRKRAFDLLTGFALQRLIKELHDINDAYGMGFSKPLSQPSQELAFKQRIVVLLQAMKEGNSMHQMAEIMKSEEKIAYFIKHHGILNLDHYLKVA